MIKPEKVTQVIVIDYSAKGYPLFELFVSAGPTHDYSSNKCFYSEDESLIEAAKEALLSDKSRQDFLTQHMDKVYAVRDVLNKYGQIHWDEMERAVYSAANKSFTIFTTKANRYARKVFSAKNEEAFLGWMTESQKILATTDAAELVVHTVSVSAFKNSRIYRNYPKQFDQYVNLHNLDVRPEAKMPSMLKLIDAIHKNKHVINGELSFDNKTVYLSIAGAKYEIFCTNSEYGCEIDRDFSITGSTCDELISKIALFFLNKRLISVGY